MSNGSGHRWSKFWWQDWQNDQALKRCSLAARGLWMGMLCIAYEGEPRGYLRLNGSALGPLDVRDMLSPCSLRDVKRLLEELENKGVFSRDTDGAIFSRRMVKDAQVSDIGREHVAKRWENKPTHPNRGATSKPNGEAKSEPFTKSTEAESERKKESFHFYVLEEGGTGKNARMSDEIMRHGNPDDGTPSLDEIMRRRQAEHAQATELETALGRSLRHVEYPPGQRPARSRNDQLDAITPPARPKPAPLAPDQLRAARIAAGITINSFIPPGTKPS